MKCGELALKKEYESCEENKEQEIYKSRNETFVKKGIRIKLQDRKAKEILITSPKYKHEICISPGNQ